MTSVWAPGSEETNPVIFAQVLQEHARQFDNYVLTTTLTSSIREKLSAGRTYYVRTDGSDSNDGLANSAGGAFLTLQKAIDTVATLDINTQSVTIQVGNGTYTAGVVVSGPFLGTGTVTLLGDATTPSNVIISVTSSNCIRASNYGSLSVSGFKLVTTTSGHCVNATNGGVVTISGNVEFGAAATYHIRASQYGVVNINANYSITGGSAAHAISLNGGSIFSQSRTVTLTGTPAITYFAYVTRLGLVDLESMTYSGAATGTRYTADTNGVIYTNGGGATYFPGSIAGITGTGGQYA